MDERGDIRDSLIAHGVPEDVARQIAYEIVAEGIWFSSWEAAGSRTRSGGPGLLPPGEAWPRGASGRPLTFLAGLDLSELPRVDDDLPDAGWLLFYVGVEDDTTHMLWVPRGTDPATADPPADLDLVLTEERLRGDPGLTVPMDADDYVPRRLGLSHPAEAWFLYLADELEEFRPWGPSGSLQTLGYARSHSERAAPADSVLLLHVERAQELGRWSERGGTIQFRIPRPALVARDWSAVTGQIERPDPVRARMSVTFAQLKRLVGDGFEAAAAGPPEVLTGTRQLPCIVGVLDGMLVVEEWNRYHGGGPLGDGTVVCAPVAETNPIVWTAEVGDDFRLTEPTPGYDDAIESRLAELRRTLKT